MVASDEVCVSEVVVVVVVVASDAVRVSEVVAVVVAVAVIFGVVVYTVVISSASGEVSGLAVEKNNSVSTEQIIV